MRTPCFPNYYYAPEIGGPCRVRTGHLPLARRMLSQNELTAQKKIHEQIVEGKEVCAA